jgi:hypothetical protein
MSQSDYIQRKRVASQVASKNRTPLNREDNPAILSAQLLTQLKQYDLVNTIVNTRPRLNQLVPSSNLRVMEMNLNKPSATCKTYRTCIAPINTLPNTVITRTFYDIGLNRPYVDPNTISPYKLKSLTKKC